MEMSCLTSSYFSSMDNGVPPRVLLTARSIDALRQRFDSMQQMLLALPERDDFSFVSGGARFLEPVDFPLQGGAFAVVAQPLERPHTVGGGCRGSGLPGDLRDNGSLSCT